MFVTDYVLNGQRNGLTRELSSLSVDRMHFDAGLLRPFKDEYGRKAVIINTGRWTVERGERRMIREKRFINDLIRNGVYSPAFVQNATTLRKEEWLELDRVVLRASRYPLTAYADLAAANTYGGFNGMSKTILEHETMSDPGEALMDMNGTTEGRKDRPVYQLQGLPLPMIHSDFTYGSRELATSRNSGTPFDVNSGEAAGRRVAELVEKLTIGNVGLFTYGGASTQQGGYGRNPSIYGYLNFPPRVTYTGVRTPTGSNPDQTVADVLAMRNLLYAGKFRGPYMLYHSPDWDQYMDNDYARAVVGATSIATTLTLRQRLRNIGNITDVRRLDFMFATAPITNTASASYKGPGGEGVSANPFTLILVQMTPDVARAVNGLDITTVQWETKGGMELNFKVMCIQVPQLRADFYGNCGICVGTTH